MNNLKEKYKAIKTKFAQNWKNLKSSPRTEIHINSISLHSTKISTIEKFVERENNQLSRFISLADPNVELIYITPIPIGKEVLAYYYSILNALGIENVAERIHIIVPVLFI